MGTFEVYSDADGFHRFRLLADTGEIVATSKQFLGADAAKRGCEAVRVEAAGAQVVEV